MRLLLVITRGDNIGGAQLYVRSIATRLQRDHHQVLVVTGTTGPLTELLAEGGIATAVCTSLQRQLHPINDVRAVRELGRIIHAFDPDLVSAHSSKAGIVARIASRLQNVPCVFTAHGWSFADGIRQPGRTIWRWVERLTEPLATSIICVSAADRDLALNYGFNRQRLVVIHNGIVDMPVQRRLTTSGNSPVRVVMIARFSGQKDHTSLLHAIRDLPACELDLVGDGPLEQSMIRVARQLGIVDRVRFHGYLADVSNVLGDADIFVLSSHYEGFPLTTLEAMRAGLPTIVSNVGGAGEAVVNGVTGFVVPRDCPDALRERIRYLIDHPGLRKSMGLAARAAFLDAFTFDRMYGRTLSVYKNAARTGVSDGVVSTTSGHNAVRREGSESESDESVTGVSRSMVLRNDNTGTA